MPKKRFNAEQIVTLLRHIEVSIAQGKSAGAAPASHLALPIATKMAANPFPRAGPG